MFQTPWTKPWNQSLRNLKNGFLGKIFILKLKAWGTETDDVDVTADRAVCASGKQRAAERPFIIPTSEHLFSKVHYLRKWPLVSGSVVLFCHWQEMRVLMQEQRMKDDLVAYWQVIKSYNRTTGFLVTKHDQSKFL